MAWVTKQTALRNKTGYFYEGKEISLTKRQGWDGKMTPGRKQHAQRRGRVLIHKGNWYPDNLKIEAAALYAVVRDFKTVKELTGIAEHALKKFATEPWWAEVISKVRREKNEELDGKITEVLHKAVDMVKDRMEDGEYVRIGKDEEGKPIYDRVPLRTRDVTHAFDVLFVKRQLIRGEATTRSETVTEDKKLQTLKENFERLAKSKQINPDGEVIDEIPDNMEEYDGSTGMAEGTVETETEENFDGTVSGRARETV